MRWRDSGPFQGGPSDKDRRPRSRVGFVFFLAPLRRSLAKAFVLALFLGCPAAAQEATEPTSEDFRDWRVTCGAQEDGGRSCVMRQERLRENGQRLLAVEIGRQDGNAVATLLLPFGILFEAGVAPQVDDEQRAGAASIRTCLPSGCVAIFRINRQMLEQMRKGTSLDLTVTTVAGEELTLPVSLRGFTVAYRRLLESSSDQ